MGRLVRSREHLEAVETYVADRGAPLDVAEATCVGVVAALARQPRLRDMHALGVVLDAAIREGA